MLLLFTYYLLLFTFNFRPTKVRNIIGINKQKGNYFLCSFSRANCLTPTLKGMSYKLAPAWGLKDTSYKLAPAWGFLKILNNQLACPAQYSSAKWVLEIRKHQEGEKGKGRSENKAIEPIEQAPMPWEYGAAILFACHTLELGFDQVAQGARYYQYRSYY